jgi:hypothetical protein
MRSNLVFRASDKVSNRFELCLLVARSARKMNHGSAQMHEAINKAFDTIGRHVGLFTTLNGNHDEATPDTGTEAEQVVVEATTVGR